MKEDDVQDNLPLEGAGGATATATAKVTDEVVTDLKLTFGGTGYTATPSVTLTGGQGNGAAALATVQGGSVSSVRLLTGGHGYKSDPDVRISLDGGAALLTYAMLTNPSPLQVPQSPDQKSTLSLSVTNPGSVIVGCEELIVILPGPSQNAQDLTNSFTGIGVVVPTDPLTNDPLWTSTQNGGLFSLKPVSAKAGEIGSSGLLFTFTNILVNNSYGTCQVAIAERASSPIAPLGLRDAPPIALEKWPPQFSISGPTANPLQIVWNTSTLIIWSVVGQGASCELIYDADGTGNKTFPVDKIGSKTATNLTNPAGVIFTLQVTLPVEGQSSPLIAQRQVAVTIIPAPAVDFEITPNDVVLGKLLSFTLHWKVNDVSNFQVTAQSGDGQPSTLPIPFSTEGTYVVTPNQLATTYTLKVLSSTASIESI